MVRQVKAITCKAWERVLMRCVIPAASGPDNYGGVGDGSEESPEKEEVPAMETPVIRRGKKSNFKSAKRVSFR